MTETLEELLGRAETIAARISDSEGERRYTLHQDLHRALVGIKLRGGAVPEPLRRLDLDLIDEETEALFDNMPV